VTVVISAGALVLALSVASTISGCRPGSSEEFTLHALAVAAAISAAASLAFAFAFTSGKSKLWPWGVTLALVPVFFVGVIFIGLTECTS